MALRPDQISTERDEDDNDVESWVSFFGDSVAIRLSGLIRSLFPQGPPVRFIFWDHSSLEGNTTVGTIVVRSRDALTRLIASPDELGLARAYVSGEVDIEGDIFATLEVLHRALGQLRFRAPEIFQVLNAARRVGAIRRPPAPPAEEIRLSGWRHSVGRDAAAVSHHYDVGNEFYRLVLGPSLTYSCARFARGNFSLEQAQAAKHDLVCRKLGLHERMGARVLDIGCGWGSMALHAATHYGATVVGVTLSAEQAKVARDRVAAAGLEDRVDIRLEDYRTLGGEKFDAVSSVGMFEHVGGSRMNDYFRTMHSLLAPTGRLLNHAISRQGGSQMRGRTFINRYVFPDGELIDVGDVVRAMERAGFEVRDVESLREHYSRTLHAWVRNLDRSWDRAVSLVGEPRARVWRLYMAASANGFDDGHLAIHQVLGVVPRTGGQSGMSWTRASWESLDPAHIG